MIQVENSEGIGRFAFMHTKGRDQWALIVYKMPC
jgi:hypothetical protein